MFQFLKRLFLGGAKQVESIPPTDTIDDACTRVSPPQESGVVMSPAVKSNPSEVISRARRIDTTVLLGIDFGTHSTKVVCRERRPIGYEAQIVAFDEPAKGYPQCASPSLVSVDEGRLYFGTTALNRSSGKLFRSLKVELIPGCQRPKSDFPDGVDSRLLIATYLSWAFQRVYANLGKFQGANKLLNISAPMDHFKNSRLQSSYLSILQTAWKLAFDDSDRIVIEQGIDIEKVQSIIEPLLDSPLEPESQRPFGVMPETIAPIVSVSLNPLYKPGMYAVVDVGAATTEVSIFHIGNRGSGQKVVCYQDTTRLVGGNDLESNGDPSELAVERVIDLIRQQFQAAWQAGFLIDARGQHARNRWKELTVLTSGGGTLHPKLAGFLNKFNPKQQFELHRDLLGPVIRERHYPQQLAKTQQLDRLNLSMFAVANGLAIDEPQWPEIHSDIKPISAPTQVDKPMGYWYVDS
jgi:hypothetical protein